eukprot:2090965-Rhodomonas_salina.4
MQTDRCTETLTHTHTRTSARACLSSVRLLCSSSSFRPPSVIRAVSTAHSTASYARLACYHTPRQYSASRNSLGSLNTRFIARVAKADRTAYQAECSAPSPSVHAW